MVSWNTSQDAIKSRIPFFISVMTIAFALRLAMLEWLFEPDEPMPFIIDDILIINGRIIF